MRGFGNVFKKVGNKAQNLFNKASGAAENIYKKGSDIVSDIKEKAPAVLGDISSGAASTANILNKVSKIAGKIGSSPITGSIPLVGSAIQTGANLVATGAKGGAKISGLVSEASNLKNYKKGGVNKQLENAQDLINRGKEISKASNELGAMVV